MNERIKGKIKEYSIKYPTYYDLLAYVIQLERKIREMEK